jgi:hypothetical protein
MKGENGVKGSQSKLHARGVLVLVLSPMCLVKYCVFEQAGASSGPLEWDGFWIVLFFWNDHHGIGPVRRQQCSIWDWAHLLRSVTGHWKGCSPGSPSARALCRCV